MYFSNKTRVKLFSRVVEKFTVVGHHKPYKSKAEQFIYCHTLVKVEVETRVGIIIKNKQKTQPQNHNHKPQTTVLLKIF